MNFETIKSSFPIFRHQPKLVYADSASTTQKPEEVIWAMNNFYENENANVHRGLYKLSEESTIHYEEVRHKVARFIGASHPNCIAFTKGTTESINMIAFGFLKNQLKPGDEVLISAMEHHANLIPWQQVCKEIGARLSVIPIDEKGNLVLEKLGERFNHQTKLLAITHQSNTLGTVNPIREIIAEAHHKNIPVLIDAAQSVSHLPINVNTMGADFLAFSAHKMFGPMGTGVLYAHEKFHAQISPLNYGGGAIRNVEFTETEFLDYPRILEAGTPNVGGVIGLGAAIEFLNSINQIEVSEYVSTLGQQLRKGLENIPGINVVGNSQSGIVSFVDEKIHPHDIASFLASKNIAVRAGHHCTQPLLDRLGILATVRASFSIYNTAEDVEKVLEAMSEVKKFWT